MPSAALAAISDDFTSASTFSWPKVVRPSRPFENFSNCSVAVFWASATKVSTFAVASWTTLVTSSVVLSAVALAAVVRVDISLSGVVLYLIPEKIGTLLHCVNSCVAVRQKGPLQIQRNLATH